MPQLDRTLFGLAIYFGICLLDLPASDKLRAVKVWAFRSGSLISSRPYRDGREVNGRGRLGLSVSSMLRVVLRCVSRGPNQFMDVEVRLEFQETGRRK